MSAAIYKVTRREFLRQTGVGAGALVLGCAIAPSLSAAEPGIVHKLIHGFPVEGVPFVALKLNGDIVIITHRSEMGQGIRSSLAAVLADELEADWNRVSLRQADADSTKYGVEFPFDVPPELQLPRPYDRRIVAKPQYVVDPEVAQFTDSSRSMAAYYAPMRLFGAGIRLVMIRVAAKKFGVPADRATEECYAEQHKVVHRATGRRIDYSRLLLGARKEPLPTYEEITAALKKPNEYRFIGKDTMPFVDAQNMVTGKTEYGADIRLRGMLTAMIERSPVANGRIGRYDDTETRSVPGVVDVIPVVVDGPIGVGGVGGEFVPHAGVAVLATNTWAAWQGRRKLKIDWDYGSDPAKTNATYDSEEYRKTLDRSARTPSEKVVRVRGRLDDAFARAADTVEECYYVPHLAQAPMEPPVAVALFEHGRLELWAPTQNPDYSQQRAGAVAFGIPPERWDTEETKAELRQKVTLHVPILGGGFGRKSKPDYVVEAAYLAAKKPGVPIRVQWTREDDIKFSYFNAVACEYLKASLGADGRPTALLWRSAFPSLFGTLFPPPRHKAPEFDDVDRFWAKRRESFFEGGEYPYGSSAEWAQGLEDMPYDVPNLRIENGGAENRIRIGWMRSVANVYHAFALSSFADELARKARRDPKDYLLDLIGKGGILNLSAEGVRHPSNNEFPAEQINVPTKVGKVLTVIPGYPPDTRRLRAVVERVARESGWNEKRGRLPKGRGLGIAAHRSFLSYVALVFEVSLNDANQLTIHDAWAAVDCGFAVNPDRVRAQVEGGINYGLSMALLGEITAKEGKVVQNNFDDYPVLRIHQAPKNIHIYFEVPSAEVRKDLKLKDGEDAAPTGVGEPPTPVVAPALANAIVAAGGPRIREIPFRKHIDVF